MPGLQIHTSNRLEALLARLAEVTRDPLDRPLQPETILVQSLGMRRWLSLALAEQHGICANVAFLFPQTFIQQVLALAVGEKSAAAVYDRAVMTWRIMRLLPGLMVRPEFAPLRHYIGGERAALKRFQLAGKLAAVFDQYFAFRPELILRWDDGADPGEWQAILWRALAAEAPAAHLPALGQRLIEVLRTNRVSLAEFPSRVSIFGISTLPKFYLDMFAAIAGKLDVHLFLMEPTPHWWGDALSGREAGRILRQQKNRELTATDLHLDSPNTLLGAVGKQGREFLSLLHELDPAAEHEVFVDPGEGALLHTIQSDIFHLREPENRHPISSADRSLQVHSCHSAMRELEVLHDALLALFDENPTLNPRDILVLMPDIDAYASAIEAVFGTPENERLRIPFSIADRRLRAESGVVDAFFAVLELVGSRMTASSVLTVLETRAVLQKFALTEPDAETIRVWIEKAAIRWGIDAAHRAQFDVPAFAQNTWREGMDRLLLGYAMPLAGEALFEGLLPVDEIEGTLADTLGALAEFTSTLFEIAEDFRQPRRLDRWRADLRSAVERLFEESDETERELALVRGAIDALGETMRLSGFAEPVDFDLVLATLAGELGAPERASGFLTGGVTFCALKPMRSIPARVICLLGMNGTAFPRHAPALGFDLMARAPKRGDRNLRDDDRYLFLEALLSARDVFYLSYVGQSQRDNSPLPPSVLVSELLDYAERYFKLPAGGLVTQHKLQPFNPVYFRDGELASFSIENCRASVAAQEHRAAAQPLVSVPLAPPEEEFRHVEIESLVRFFRNPAKAFARDRLGLVLVEAEEGTDDREPFEIAGLKRYALEQLLVEKSAAGGAIESLLPLVRAAGELPAGNAGHSEYGTICAGVIEFARLVREVSTGELLPPQSVQLRLGEFELTGTISSVRADALVRCRLAQLQPKDMLALWIRLLVLNCESPRAGVLLGEKKGGGYSVQRYAPPENAREILGSLLEYYWQGLREPLPFFPEASHAFVTAKKDNRQAALDVWEGGYNRGERDDVYYDLTFQNAPEPLGARFEEIARAVWEPLLAARMEEKA